METNVIHANASITKQNAKQEVSEFPCKKITLDSEIQQIRCNCDGSMIAIVVLTSNGPFAFVYHVQLFSLKVFPTWNIKFLGFN